MLDPELLNKCHMFSGLRHTSVSSSHDKNSSVQLTCTLKANLLKRFKGIGHYTCDHVLDKIRVARAVGVGVMSVLCAVLDVSHIDGDASVPLLRGVVNRSIIAELSKR